MLSAKECGIWVLLFPLVVKAEKIDSYFNVSPSTCVTEQRECKGEFTLNWQLARVNSVCLVVVDETEREVCNLPSIQFELSILVNSDKEIELTLIDQNTRQRLAQTNVLVLKPYKKSPRRRISWSLF